jgi:hypothetical protein
MMKFFSKHRKVIASFLLLVIVFQLGYVPAAFALTSGASQPEAQSFQPASTSEMVDLFTGDFSYNIPLFELPGPNGGYPFNLSYQSGVGMDTESSWVGLGFNLNPGAINRQMRGLPDEFKGDSIKTKMSLEPSVTIGVGIGTGVELFGGALGLGMGLGVYRNNYKGIGYSIDGSVSFQKSTGGGMTGGIGLSVSADSKAGVSVQPSLSLGYKSSTVGLTAGYNSRQGLTDISASYTYTHSRDIDINYKDREGRQKKATVDAPNISGTGGVNISLASPSYTPQMTMAMQNLSLSTTFKIGGAWWGVSYTGNVTGYYNEQRLRDKGKVLWAPAYGYFNYQFTEGDNVLMDFNREKDGPVSKESPNLAIPALTYDIYSVSGQGISAMYRPVRNDIGVVRDQKVESGSVGGSFGVDVGIPAHVGTNLMINHSRSTSGAWTDNNDVYKHERFAQQQTDSDYEPWHFQVHGERVAQPVAALDGIWGENPVEVRLDGTDLIGTKAGNVLEARVGGGKLLPEAAEFKRQRQPRSNVIQTITIGELLRDTTVMMPLFKVKYDSAGTMKKLRHELVKKPHHVAGYTALTPEGLRYTYGIPVYNTYQEEVVFSARKASLSAKTSRVDVVHPSQGEVSANDRDKDPYFAQKDSDKFMRRVMTPAYAHSYLLTSIVGSDYVDVTNNGVTKDDLGYWVKFTYRKTADGKKSPYKWRDPYSSAHLQEGWKTDPRDDRGSFTYGEKEVWYLERAETKSHIADFTISTRDDGKGVKQKLQNDNLTNVSSLQGKALYKLDAVTLYARTSDAAHAIKTVKFDYDYSLCKKVYNGTNNGGKLTLKKLWFEYGGSTGSARGSLNPYVFNYHETIAAENPDYDQHAYDRWGSYKPYPTGDYTRNVDFPYAEQDSTKKEEIDRNAAVWSLREIRLPSGGKILIDYETDDYAYVQHKQAMQMVPIVTPQGSDAPAEFTLQDDGEVYFKLQRPLPGNVDLDTAKQHAEVLKYLDLSRKQLYFKIKLNLRSASEDLFEYISGYADINFKAEMRLHKVGSNYTYGSFYLFKEEEGTHPFSLRGWQHLRTNQPELSNSSTPLMPTEDNDERVRQMKTLGNAFTQLDQMFKGFYQWCREHQWSREIRINESWVRLNCIDKVKYGGGLRVKQLAMLDNWKDDTDGAYGQVYNYTTEDEDGTTISSGVAAYEPLIGGEENALRYAKRYVESVPLRSDNNMFFEYPINESYYPGPQVGYSRVTVRSLAAASLEGENILVNGQRVVPQKAENVAYGTTGVSISEFYTAREFPVFTDELDKVNKPFKLSVTIPLLGTIGVSLLSTSQGYSIITNDMHGKPKMTSTYKQSPQGAREEKPSSWVRYNYQQEDRVYDGAKVKDISSYFEDKGDGTLSLADSLTVVNNHSSLYSMGQESELFLDMREYEDNTWSGGGALNMDLIYIVFGVIPVFTIWPSISKSQARLRTSVANKVMFKSGTLVSMEAFDGGSTVKTEYQRWDKVTGACVLTTVTNNFNAPIYNYTINAHTQYQGMGPAYQNAGLTFSVTDVDPLKPSDAASSLYLFRTTMPSTRFVPGDEFLLYPKEGGFVRPVSLAVYVGIEDGQLLLHSRDKLADASYDARIVRSGYRNQLNVAAGTITALQNPLVQGSTVNYSKTIRVTAH